MLDYQQQLIAERTRDFHREAHSHHRAQALLGQRGTTPFYAPALERLGHVLIARGLSLRVRYGRLDLGEGVEV